MFWQENRPANAIRVRFNHAGQANPAFADPTGVVNLLGATTQRKG